MYTVMLWVASAATRDKSFGGPYPMNATSLDELRATILSASGASKASDEAATQPAATEPATAVAPETSADRRMEQIRQLLLGDSLEAGSERLAALEKRQSDFERTVMHRLDLISQRLDALSRDVLADRRAAFDELARAMQDLGNRVRGI
jgi:hypothetical protein